MWTILYCYIPDFGKVVVAWEFIVEFSIYVWCILIRDYICESCYTLEFMRLKLLVELITLIFRNAISGNQD